MRQSRRLGGSNGALFMLLQLPPCSKSMEAPENQGPSSRTPSHSTFNPPMRWLSSTVTSWLLAPRVG
uniref:Uncharacterized protein n=1 Tax=Arundo donax TaxID=35708 RepID=A0A0A9HQN6_ARUDO